MPERHGAQVILLVSILFLISMNSHSQPNLQQQTRALWVTRWDYETRADVERIITNADLYHFNMILFQVRGNGTVFYRSQIEPWAEEFDYTDPGWDPLATAIELAHQRDIQLHAWVNVYPGWRGIKPPSLPSQLFFTHPDWFMVDEFGHTLRYGTPYSWLSPTNPEVQNYLQKVLKEIYTRYNIDGLHLDYFRFPAPAYSYDQASLQLFKLKYGANPSEKPLRWERWRQEAITNFLAALHREMSAYNPKLILSCAVSGDYDTGVRLFRQNSHEWLARGIIDIIFPMIYTQDDTLFANRLNEHLLNAHDRFVLPGIYAYNPQNLVNQIQIADSLGCQGVAIFAYKNLFNNPADTLATALSRLWPEQVPTARLPWREYYRDTQGPAVVEVHTIPLVVRNGMKFKIAARIVDPSGVFDAKTGPEEQGVYLIYGQTWPPKPARQVTMSRIKGSKDWYLTDKTIQATGNGLDFRCRIFAWDNYHESASHPKRNRGYSDVWSLSILNPNQSYVCKGEFGPVLWRPSAVEVAPNGSIWISSSSEHHVTILQADGKPVNFSPITSAQRSDGSTVDIESINGLAFMPPNIMYVSSSSPDNMIYRFNIDTGEPLPGIELNFPPSELACDHEGHIFVMVKNTTVWNVLNEAGLILQGSPFGVNHTGNDIAVLDDAQIVLLTDRTTNRVQVWKGAVEGLRARYWHVFDLANKVGLGKVSVSSEDYLYISQANQGLVTIYDRTGQPQEHLYGSWRGLNAPREIGVSVTGDSLYIMETAGNGPTKLSLWVREKR